MCCVSVDLPVCGFEVFEEPSSLEDELAVITAKRGIEGNDDIATIPASDSHCLIVVAVEVVRLRLAQPNKGNDQLRTFNPYAEISFSHLQHTPFRDSQSSNDLRPQSAAGHRCCDVMHTLQVNDTAMDELDVPIDHHKPILRAAAKVQFWPIAYDIPAASVSQLLVDA